jgi:hypothetical protein
LGVSPIVNLSKEDNDINTGLSFPYKTTAAAGGFVVLAFVVMFIVKQTSRK